HEEHRDRGDPGDVDSVVAGTACQLEGAIPLGGDRVAQPGAKPFVHRGATVASGWFPNERGAPALARLLDSRTDFGKRLDARLLGGVTDLTGEPDLTRDDVGGAGPDVELTDRRDESVCRPANRFDGKHRFRGGGQGILAQRRRE